MTGTKFAILGGGAWGLALAKLLSGNQHAVKVWEFNREYAQNLQVNRTNPSLLKDVILPDSILISNSLSDILSDDTEHIVFATPSQFLRQTIKNAAPLITGLTNIKSIVNVAKGIEEDTMKRMSEVLCDELPLYLHDKIVCLSGPSHAEEVARQIPTAVVVAGNHDELLQTLQNLLSNEYFRVYRTSDLTGVEIGGAVKNIISIAAGIIDGLGYGDNTKGALLTRGIVEIQRLGIRMGANPETFYGLSGLGDLVTTAISQHSRNLYVGLEIGKGNNLHDILAGMKAVAEGVATTRSVHALSHKLHVEMPITDQIFEVLFKGKSPRQAMVELMTRSPKSE